VLRRRVSPSPARALLESFPAQAPAMNLACEASVATATERGIAMNATPACPTQAGPNPYPATDAGAEDTRWRCTPLAATQSKRPPPRPTTLYSDPDAEGACGRDNVSRTQKRYAGAGSRRMASEKTGIGWELFWPKITKFRE
jgi:hypothetical protein